MSTTTPFNIILDDDKDWLPWLEIIKSVAIENDLWDHINPSVSPERLKKLVDPIEPTPASVKSIQPATPAVSVTSDHGITQQTQAATPATISEVKFSDLSTAEQAQLQMQQQLHLHKLRLHEEKVKAMGKLRTRIQQTIAKRHFQYTRRCTYAWEMMRNLKNRFAPTDKAREQEVSNAWLMATNKPQRGKSIEKWVGDLESAYDEAVEFELPEVQGLHPHYALTMAVKDIAPSFSYDWNKVLIKHTSADANSISFQGMIKEFRDLRRLNESQAAPRARHGAFAASFQGQNADGSPKVYKCIYAEEHRYARCLYLIPEIRPSG